MSSDWEAWGPNGGHIAAVALRAVQAHSAHPRPATMSAHFVSAARFGPVDIDVTTLRASQRPNTTTHGGPVGTGSTRSRPSPTPPAR
ncbi:acyl-CoA thioesterase domain-containing protein [Actinomadura sp. DC4]|uniref:acyl-CoA thioesterase domain-containing protein n=1 Tax=Actinomadura sp. DC4 TaxID=3055069 RepID=UPI00339D95BE